MEGNIFGSIFFIIAFLCLFFSVLFLQKKEQEDLLPAAVRYFITILCYGALIAGVLSVLHIPVHIMSMGIVYVISSIPLWYLTIKRKSVQKLRIKGFDCFILLCTLIGVAGIVLIIFSKTLELRYWTSDAAVHMISANAIVLEQKVSSMYFAPLYNAMIMELFQPWFNGINIYKGFIIADGSMLILEVLIFYLNIRPLLKKNSYKVMGTIAIGLYVAGYPLHSFLYTFNHWGVGVLMIGYLMIVIQEYFQEKITHRQVTIELMLGCLGVITSYMLFAPITFILVFVIMIYYVRKQNQRVFTKKNVFWALEVFFIPCVVGVYYGYVQFFKSQQLEVGEALTNQGAIHRELYMDFIWLIPVVLFVIFKSIRKKKWNPVVIFMMGFFAVTILILPFSYKGYISSYYYYKMYYPLWMLMFIVSLQGILTLWEEERELCLSLFAVFAGVFVMAFGKVETKIIESGAALQLENKSLKVFGLYETNLECLKRNWSLYQISDEYLKLYEYVVENLSDEPKDVPMFVGGDQYPMCYWYMAFTNEHCQEYYGWQYEIDANKKVIEEGKIDYAVILYTSEYYTSNREYWNGFDKVYQTTVGCIIKTGK